MKLLVHTRAELQIQQAASWYEQRHKGLGMEFLRAIDTALALIRRQPEAFAKVLGEVRRITVRRFPYALFYIHDHEVQAIRVLRCLHQHRDPRTWPQ